PRQDARIESSEMCGRHAVQAEIRAHDVLTPGEALAQAGVRESEPAGIAVHPVVERRAGQIARAHGEAQALIHRLDQAHPAEQTPDVAALGLVAERLDRDPHLAAVEEPDGEGAVPEEAIDLPVPRKLPA